MKGGDRYDFSFLRTDSSDTGFMLDEKNGKKRYENFTDPSLAQQFFTGEVSYGSLPPEKELALIQSNYEAGFGQEFYNSASVNEFRYYSSSGVDARFRDNLICGPKATAIAIPVAHAAPTYIVLNPGFEDWTSDDPDNWTPLPDGSVETQETTIKDAGASSCKISVVTDTVTFYVEQSFSDPTEWIGYKIILSVRRYLDTVSNVTAGLSLYRNGALVERVATPENATTWETLTLTEYTVPTGTTSLTIRCDLVTTSDVTRNAYYDTVTLSYTAATAKGYPVAFAEFNSILYVAFGKFLYKLNGTGDGWTFVGPPMGTEGGEPYGFTTEITDLEPFIDDNLYICVGSTVNKYWYMATNEALTQSNLGDGYALYMSNVAGTMHKAILANQIKKATDPTNAGSWGAAITVGSTYTDITDLINEQDIIYIGKEDLAYYLDSNDAAIPLNDEISALTKSTNCKNMIAWHRNVYLPLGENSLGEYATDGTWTWRSPSLFMTNLSDFSGQVQALAADEEYIYAILDNSTKLEILAGKISVVSGTSTWVWHPIQQITLTGAEVAFVSSVYKKRLWIASTSSSDSLYYIPLTTKYGDITGDANYLFQTGGTLVASWLHANLKSDSKGYHKLTLTTEGCDANNYITVEYQTYFTALTGSWTNLGNFTTSPSQTRYFSGVTGTMIRPRFTLVTDSTSTTPKLINFDCRGIWRPIRRKLIACVVKLGNNILPRTGQPSEDYQSMKDAIVEAYDKDDVNTFYDIDSKGTTIKYCNLLHAREFDVVLTEGKNPESKFELLFEEITLS